MCAPTEITEINLGQIINDAGILTLEDLVTDGWQKYNDRLTMFVFKNTAQSVLLIKLNDQMDGSAPNLGQVSTGNTNLNIVRYKCNRLNTPVYQGTPVVFVLEHEKKSYYLYCEKGEKSEPTIRVVPGAPPTDISNWQSGYIFHQQIFSGQYYQFESALHRDWYVCSRFQGQRYTIGLKKTEKKVDETVLLKVA